MRALALAALLVLSGCGLFAPPQCPDAVLAASLLTVEGCRLAAMRATTEAELERLEALCPIAADLHDELVKRDGAALVCEAVEGAQ